VFDKSRACQIVNRFQTLSPSLARGVFLRAKLKDYISLLGNRYYSKTHTHTYTHTKKSLKGPSFANNIWTLLHQICRFSPNLKEKSCAWKTETQELTNNTQGFNPFFWEGGGTLRPEYKTREEPNSSRWMSPFGDYFHLP